MLLTRKTPASNKGRDKNSQEAGKAERIFLIFDKSTCPLDRLIFGLKKRK
jgi:hypothetical protein